jgi:hypothetical protein
MASPSLPDLTGQAKARRTQRFFLLDHFDPGGGIQDQNTQALRASRGGSLFAQGRHEGVSELCVGIKPVDLPTLCKGGIFDLRTSIELHGSRQWQ